MTDTITQLAFGALGGLGLFVLKWIRDDIKSLKKEIKESFDNVDKRFDSVNLDLADIKERLSFLEAANIYTMPIETPRPNPKSEAMKLYWMNKRSKKHNKQIKKEE